MSMILSELKLLGFKEYKNDMQPEAIKSLQLRVRSEDGDTKFFINVDLIDYTSKPYASQMPKSYLKDHQPEYSVQLTNESGTFNVEFLGRNKSVKEVIEFYHSVFNNMNCELYD
ncbi:hypothetical protein NVP1187O_226 [Vibrio phage 1.187.O._10N.286.49.F1]|nr:hypothetical protein NVP1187O_226 [Vibrio phage 1.187.O._10N.286.49.F1]